MNIIFLLSYLVFLYFECGKVIAQYQRGFLNCSKEEGLSRDILFSVPSCFCLLGKTAFIMMQQASKEGFAS